MGIASGGREALLPNGRRKDAWNSSGDDATRGAGDFRGRGDSFAGCVSASLAAGASVENGL
jgi:hypothetical protein